MEKYLLEILKDTNTIIIPGFGALTATNKEKGEYLFMPYLKHDDGNLKKFIAHINGCDEAEARTKIDQFVEAVNSKLNSGSPFQISNLGSFSKDNSGDIIFESHTSIREFQIENEDIKPFLEPIAETELVPEVECTIVDAEEDVLVIEETVQAEAVIEEEKPAVIETTIAEKEISSPIVENDIDLIDEKPEVETMVVESVKDIEPEEIVVISDDNEVVTGISSNSAEYTEQQQWEDDLDLPPINAKVERPKKPIIEKAKKDKKKRSPIFYGLIVLVVLLVGGATTVGVFYNQIKTALFVEERSDTTKLAEGKQFEFTEVPVSDTDEETLEEPEETVPEVTEQIETPEVKEVSKPKVVQPKKTNVSGSFFLVVGSFQNEANANRFSERMRSEGNVSNVIGPNNGYYLVTIGSYSTESDAKSGLIEKIQRYPKVWLYKKV